MKHLRTFENMGFLNYEQKVIDCGFYIQSQIPSEDFFDWEYTEINEEDLSVDLEFYYNNDVDDSIIEKAYEFFDEYDLEYSFNYGLHSLAPEYTKKQEIILVHIPEEIIIKFSEIFNTLKKYNL